MQSDLFIFVNTLMMARVMVSEPDAAPFYLYRFSFEGAFNVFRNLLHIKPKGEFPKK